MLRAPLRQGEGGEGNFTKRKDNSLRFMSVCWGSGVSAHEKVGQGTDRKDRVSVKRAAVFLGASRIRVPRNPPMESIHHSSLDE